jgi:C-22 sterol desaturase
MANNVSFASPLADAKYAQIIGQPQIDGVLSRLGELSIWTILLSLLLCAVAYDQCKWYICYNEEILLILAIVSYIWQKGSIVGPSWKVPFIGPFMQSLDPKFEEYKAKWASGELSCVSVFHKYV